MNELAPRRFWALVLGWLTAGIAFYAHASVQGLVTCLVAGALAGGILGPTLDRLRRE